MDIKCINQKGYENYSIVELLYALDYMSSGDVATGGFHGSKDAVIAKINEYLITCGKEDIQSMVNDISTEEDEPVGELLYELGLTDMNGKATIS